MVLNIFVGLLFLKIFTLLPRISNFVFLYIYERNFIRKKSREFFSVLYIVTKNFRTVSLRVILFEVLKSVPNKVFLTVLLIVTQKLKILLRSDFFFLFWGF